MDLAALLAASLSYCTQSQYGLGTRPATSLYILYWFVHLFTFLLYKCRDTGCTVNAALIGKNFSSTLDVMLIKANSKQMGHLISL